MMDKLAIHESIHEKLQKQLKSNEFDPSDLENQLDDQTVINRKVSDELETLFSKSMKLNDMVTLEDYEILQD